MTQVEHQCQYQTPVYTQPPEPVRTEGSQVPDAGLVRTSGEDDLQKIILDFDNV